MRLSVGILASIFISTCHGLQCLTCQHTMNSLNETDGALGNPKCWEDAESIGTTVECPLSGQGCITDLYAQWTAYGKQIFTIVRGCDVPRECWEGHRDNYKAKQCATFCTTDNCNSDMSVAEYFTSPNNQQECQACRYHETDNGDQTGNKNCKTNDPNNAVTCPSFANMGCYTGTSGHMYQDNPREDVYRGCSAFDVSDPPACANFDVVDEDEGVTTQYGVCKDACVGKNCNSDEPTMPDLLGDYPSCQVCSESQHQTGEISGLGDAGCFVGDEQYLTKCTRTTDKCATEMLIDWFAKGDMHYTVNRMCISSEPPKNCLEGSSAIFHYKDCTHACEGDGCNSDLTGVSELLTSGGKVSSCHQCEWSQNADGTVDGNSNCGTVEGKVDVVDCPAYSDAACYTAASYHKDYLTPTIKETEEDYRGCSPFVLPDDAWQHCASASIAGLDHVNCKSTCLDDKCNDVPTESLGSGVPQCFTCSATRDSLGNPIGISDDACFENLKSEFLVTCSTGDICKDEMMIDWFPSGRQQITIMRGCVTPPQPEPRCLESSSSSLNYKYKDCTYYCESSHCNYDLSVGDQFSSPNAQDTCQVCSYTEHDNGDREGLPACLSTAYPNRPATCPNYANSGCYTTNNVHVTDGETRRSVIRGCSSFEGEFQECYDQTLPDENGEDQNFGVCKEFCTGENCNNKLPASPELGGSWPSCLICSVTVDNDNNTVGIGNNDCWDINSDSPNAAQYLKRCPFSSDACITEMMADWLPRGNINYNVKRFCSSEATPRFCEEGSSSLVQYKDCKSRCNPLVTGAGCNGGLDDVAKMFSVGYVQSCQSCSFAQDQYSGEQTGDIKCKEPQGSGFSQTCPSYATASCFEAASFHQDYTGGNKQVEEDYRGCSPFSTNSNNTDSRCTDMVMNGLDHTNCRRNCYENECNDQPLRRGNQCYSCTGTRDAAGKMAGTGDDGCFDDVGERHLKDCAIDETFCMDELLADWFPKGQQLFTIMRGCAKTPARRTCEQMSTSNLKYKDCQKECSNEEGACNDDMSVGNLFGGPGNSVPECNTCSYEEHDDGTVSGNKNCIDNVPFIPNVQQPCPAYATAACFSGASIHVDYGRTVEQVYKGCSAFFIDAEGGLEQSNVTLQDDENNSVGYSITKQTCSEKNCNVEHVHPLPPSSVYSAFCQVCSVTVDSNNKTIGVGQAGCWEGDSIYQTECGVGYTCTTDMQADWMPKGPIQYKVIRGCTTLPHPVPCEETHTPYFSYKDCQAICDPIEQGQGCNDGLDAVAGRFDYGIFGVDQCYSCQHYKSTTGEEFGQPTCGQAIEDITTIRTSSCPKYANAGCYHAASYHLDYTDDGTEYQEDYRGCSPFNTVSGDGMPNGNRYVCHHMELNGLDHENCKSVCVTENCNTKAARQRPTCYTCQATYDSAGMMIGVGDDRCWDLRGGDHMVMGCPRDQSFCSTEMQVDWTFKGYQQVTLRRGCSATKAPTTCYYSENERVKYKDCFETCKGNGTACNNDLHVQNKFIIGKPQQSCYTCQYYKDTNGDAVGNINCPEKPGTDLVRDACPVFASGGCYTGSGIHRDEGGKAVEEVYKGCSSFLIDGGIERTGSTIEGTTYNLVKQTCNDKANCNSGYEKPIEPWRVGDTNETANRKHPRYSAAKPHS